MNGQISVKNIKEMLPIGFGYVNRVIVNTMILHRKFGKNERQFYSQYDNQ